MLSSSEKLFWRLVVCTYFPFFVVVFFSKTPISIMMAFICKSTQASAIVANDKDQIEIHSFDYMHVHNFTLCKYLQFLCITHS